MAEVEIKASKENEGKIMPVNTQVVLEGSDGSVAGTCSEREGQENDTTGESKKQDEIQLKEQELPEPIRHKHESKRMMPCLPSINLLELATILRDPNMPSQKILKEVADKIMSRSEESESDDGSVSSGGGVVGMKGLLDCIFEVSYMHEDSDISDDDDDSFERIPRQIPCTFCNKIFGSTMTWNTHVLVAHPQQEHSVHNIRRTSVSESERKEKGHPHRKHLRSSSKSECDAKDIKAYYTSAANKKQASGEENVPVRKRHSSFSKSQHREVRKSDSKHQSSSGQLKNESPSCKSSCELMRGDKEIATVEHQRESVESDLTTCSTSETLNKVSAVEGESAQASSQQQGAENTCSNQSSSEMKGDTELPQSSGSASGTHIPVNSSEHAAALSSNSKCGRKRRTTPELPESTSVSSLSSKRSRKNIPKD